MQILFKSKKFKVKIEFAFIKMRNLLIDLNREAEQIKLLYETLNQTSFLDANRLYSITDRKFSQLEPRRSNPLDQYPSSS